MRITDNNKIDELVAGHYKQLQGLMQLYAVFEDAEKIGMLLPGTDPFKDAKVQIKFISFLTTSFIDLLILLKAFNNSKSEWENFFLAKTGIHIIHETLQTYNKTIKYLRDFIVSKYPEFEPGLKKIKMNLKDYKSRVDYDNFYEIRNKTSGHYDVDFLVFYQHVTKLEPNKSILAIEWFLGFLMSVMIFVDDVVNQQLLNGQIIVGVKDEFKSSLKSKIAEILQNFK